MAKLTITRGVSGSGKSTWAREQNAVVVSRDDIRYTQFGDNDKDYYTKDKAVLFERENLVTIVQDAMITALLKAGKDVIADNTNIEWKYVKALAKLAQKVGADVEIKTFDVPLHTAQQRAAMRHTLGGRNVEADIIRKQHDRLQGTKNFTLEPAFVPSPYHGTPGKPKAFLYDLDGTTYHMHDKRGPFAHNVDVDDPDPIVQEIVRTQAHVLIPIAMSGRVQKTRATTIDCLVRDDVPFDHLLMRADGDMRSDNIVKAELFDTYVAPNFDVQFVLDDRDQVVDMWRAKGLKCLQVQEGNF